MQISPSSACTDRGNFRLQHLAQAQSQTTIFDVYWEQIEVCKEDCLKTPVAVCCFFFTYLTDILQGKQLIGESLTPAKWFVKHCLNPETRAFLRL